MRMSASCSRHAGCALRPCAALHGKEVWLALRNLYRKGAPLWARHFRIPTSVSERPQPDCVRGDPTDRSPEMRVIAGPVGVKGVSQVHSLY